MLAKLARDSTITLASTSSKSDKLTSFLLFLFGIGIWEKWATIIMGSLLTILWISNGGLHESRRLIREPLILALILFVSTLLLGLLWSDYPRTGFFPWKSYLVLLFFIPYFSLLNKNRLPWAIAGLIVGYTLVLLAAIYYLIVHKVFSVPPLGMLYLHTSVMCGVGILIFLYLAVRAHSVKQSLLFSLCILILLFLVFNSPARGPLIAIILTIFVSVILLYRRQLKMILGISLLLIFVIAFLMGQSDIFKERFDRIFTEYSQFTQGINTTSTGHRLAFWQIGLQAISQRPLLGYGSGMAQKAFQETAVSYQGGRFVDVGDYFHLHYHNDVIEMGVLLGFMGIAAYLFLLLAWFQTLRRHHLPVLGGILVFYLMLSGLTDTIMTYRQIPLLLLTITAIAITIQREHGDSQFNLARKFQS